MPMETTECLQAWPSMTPGDLFIGARTGRGGGGGWGMEQGGGKSEI